METKNGDELKVVYPQHKFNLKTLEKLDFKFFSTTKI